MEQPLARILLPALRGGDTLGFLAALGVIHLSHSALSDTSSRLSWPHGPAEGAVVHSSIAANLDELASLLAGVAAERREPNLVPGLAAFPPNSSKPADTDPIRTVTYEGGRVFSQLALEHPVFEPWLRSILSLDQPIRSEKRHGALAVSPLAARGPGTVMLARTMRDLAAAVTTSTVISALAFWERSDTIAGYLDPQAKRNAAFAASKQDPNNYGVPAAAWLGQRIGHHIPPLGHTAWVQPAFPHGVRKHLMGGPAAAATDDKHLVSVHKGRRRA